MPPTTRSANKQQHSKIRDRSPPPTIILAPDTNPLPTPPNIIKLRSPINATQNLLSLPRLDDTPIIAVRFPRHFPVSSDRLGYLSYFKHDLSGNIYEDIHLGHKGTELEKWPKFAVVDWFAISYAFFTSSRTAEAASMTGLSLAEIEELSRPSNMQIGRDAPFYIAIVNKEARPVGRTDPPFDKKEPTFMRVVSSEVMNEEWIRNNLEVNTRKEYVISGFKTEKDASTWAKGEY